MGFPADFVSPILTCMNPTFTFPSITSPGLTNFCLASFEANFAGINYVLGFIPPSPTNPPSLPGINLFLEPFMAALSLPAAYPGIDITLGGIGISIPGVGSPPYAYDLSGELSLAAACIAAPFLIIKEFITGLLNLEIILPTLAGVETLLLGLFAEAGLVTAAVIKFAGCLASAIVSLFTALIP